MAEVTFNDLVGHDDADDDWRAVPGDDGGIEWIVDTDDQVVTPTLVAADRQIVRWFEEEDASADILDDTDFIAVIDGDALVGVVSTAVVRDALTNISGGGPLASMPARLDTELAGRADPPRPSRLYGRCGHLLETYRPRGPHGLCPDQTTPPHSFVPADEE